MNRFNNTQYETMCEVVMMVETLWAFSSVTVYFMIEHSVIQ